MKHAHIYAALYLLFVGFAGPAFAFDPSYVSDRQVELGKLLPPPPLAESARQKRDLQEVLHLQEIRTAEQADQAIKDNDTSLGEIEGSVLGDALTDARTPKLFALYSRMKADEGAIVEAAKALWNRPRPFVASTQVNAIGAKPSNASYPSGHSTIGWLTAIMLADMVPEKSTELYARAREFGRNRVMAGVHFPSDIEAGRYSASAIATALMQSSQFRSDFEGARMELRHALGLPDVGPAPR
jgi:acid phosphatase (class A)